MVVRQLLLNICRALLAILVASVITAPLFAQVEATLSATRIAEYQSIELTIVDEQDSNQQDPDLTPLATDFEYAIQSTDRSFSLVNGQFTSFRSWRIQLTPKRTGTLTIPSIQLGAYRTNPLSLVVVPLSPELRQAISEAVFLETIVSHESQYPQAALYVTRRLLYNHQVRLPPQPEEKGLTIDNASVISLGNMSQFRERHNGLEYNGMEWRYVVFAERSGTITIPSESVRAGIYPNRGRPQVRTIVAEEKVIEILPIPSTYPTDKPWFPATRVTLSETYTPEGVNRMSRGEALTRNIRLLAEDSYTSAIAPLDLGTAVGFRVYPEQVISENNLQNQSIVGRQSQEINYIASEGGEAEIPSISVTWFDVKNKEVKMASLPPLSQLVTVIDADGQSQVSTSDTPPTSSADSGREYESVFSLFTNPLFYLILALAIAGWILAGALYFKSGVDGIQTSTATNRSGKINIGVIRSSWQRGQIQETKHYIVSQIANYLELSVPKARAEIRKHPGLDTIMQDLDQVVFGNSDRSYDLNLDDLKRLMQEVIDGYQLDVRHLSLDSVLARG